MSRGTNQMIAKGMKPNTMWAIIHVSHMGRMLGVIQGCVGINRRSAIDLFMCPGTIPENWKDWEYPTGQYVVRKVTISTLPEKPRATTRERKKGRK